MGQDLLTQEPACFNNRGWRKVNLVKLRRWSPLVVAGFLATHITACACSFTSLPNGQPPKAKPADHGCCSSQAQEPQQPSKPVSSSCCCDDASHFAVADEPSVAVKSLIVEPPPDLFPVPVSVEARRPIFDGSPPGRVPDVPLYTLHVSLLI